MDIQTLVAQAMGIEGATFPQEVEFLYTLALQAPLQTQFVELGTYQGRTVSVILAAAHQRQAMVYTLDDYSYTEAGSWVSSVVRVRHNLEAAGVSGLERLQILHQDSRQVPDGISQVGFLFVDSTHTRAHFEAEMAHWSPYFTVGTVVACHDYDSPRWREMTGAINDYFRRETWTRLGVARRLIGFKKLR